jgi:hypothetical protein
MHQLSLVALYGTKNEILEKIILQCQKEISDTPDIEFQPYQVAQIHATITSLERLDRTRYNLNFFNYRNQKKIMDFEKFIRFLRESNYFSFQVQIGGFENKAYPFTSREHSPFIRSFQITHDKLVLLGWPVHLQIAGKSYPNTLDELRKNCQTHNILHTYHQNKLDIDNDFYLRLGIVNPKSLTAKSKKNLENKVRAFLSSCAPVILEIKTSNTYFACYTNNELPVNTTRAWPISDPKLTPEFLWDLYSSLPA